MAVISSLVVFVCLLCLWWTFSLTRALVIVGIGLLNMASSLGAAGLLGWRMSQFSMTALPFIMVVSLLDNIHLAYAYCDLRRRGLSHSSANSTSVARLLRPCWWTSLTTLAGFGALLLSEVPRIRGFAALCMVGTAWAFLSSFALLGPALRFGSLHFRNPVGSLLSRWTQIRRPSLVVTIAVLALSLTAPGLRHLRIHADYPRLFRDDHPITREAERIEREWTGMASVSYLLTPKEGVSLTDARVRSRLRDFVGLLASRELGTSVASPLDLVSLAERSYLQEFGRRPGDKDLEKMLGPLAGGKTPSAYSAVLAPWVHPESHTLRITARVRMMRPERFPELAADLQGFQTNLKDLFEVGLTGWPLLYKNLERRMLDELLRGFILAFAIVGLLLFPALGSVRWWLVAVAVNILPLWVVMGTLDLSGAGFSSELLVAPAVALGLIVDDTIHFLVALRRSNRNPSSGAPGASPSHDERVVRTIAEVATPITISSLVLAAGFSCLYLSVFRGNQWLACIMSGLVLTAWLADVFLLPVLLSRSSPHNPDLAG